jgi:hypothetical protein
MQCWVRFCIIVRSSQIFFIGLHGPFQFDVYCDCSYVRCLLRRTADKSRNRSKRSYPSSRKRVVGHRHHRSLWLFLMSLYKAFPLLSSNTLAVASKWPRNQQSPLWALRLSSPTQHMHLWTACCPASLEEKLLITSPEALLIVSPSYEEITPSSQPLSPTQRHPSSSW